MFKRHHQLFTAFRVALDLGFLGVAFWGAWGLRFGSPRTWPYTELPGARETAIVAVLAALIWPFAFRAVGLYRPQRHKTPLDEMFSVFKATLVAGLMLVALTYFVQEARYSRGMLAMFSTLAFLGISLERVFFKELLQALRRRGYNQRYILVLGAGRLARQVLEQIDLHRELGFRAVGCLSLTKRRVGTSVGGVEVIGTIREDLRKAIHERGVDQVLVALPSRSAHHLPRIMDVCADTTVDVKLVPDVYQYATLFGGLEEFGGLPVVNLQSTGMLGINAVAKRIFDLIFSALFLIVVSPVLAVLALLVKSTPGPVLFRQERVGLDGKPFQMLKFRTMRADAEALGPQFAQANDPRTTPLGAWLRRTSLDELPQLWNVFKGDMSLVGPRPERPVFIDQFRRRIPRYQLRHMVKAGMTGWAQIHGLRGNTSIQKRVEYDLYYIEHWSLLLDLRILARTVAFGFLSRNAY